MVVVVVSFETQSSVVQSVLKTTLTKDGLEILTSFLCLPSADITGMYNHTQLKGNFLIRVCKDGSVVQSTFCSSMGR